MTLEEVVIAVVRIAGSLPVLWFPFAGGILAVLVDFSDLFMMNLLDLGGVRDYQVFDKWVDQVYMVAFLIVALRWKGVPRSGKSGRSGTVRHRASASPRLLPGLRGPCSPSAACKRCGA